MEKKVIEYQIYRDRVDKEIREFRKGHGYSPYLFASRSTLDLLCSATEFCEPKRMLFASGMVAEFQGCRVYENESIDFGSIEFR